MDKQIDEKTLNAIHNYYKLKNEYESHIKHDKMKLLNNKFLSIKEKRSKFIAQKSKYKCIVCGTQGGTIFSHEGRTIRAYCGSMNKHCKLDIEINLGDYDTLPDVLSNLSNVINVTKTEIILTKLNLLFENISEQNAIATFEGLKKIAEEDEKSYKDLLMLFMQITNNPQKIVNIENDNVVLHDAIIRLNDIINHYNQKRTSDVDISIFARDAIELYTSEIIPTLNRLRENMYVHGVIESDVKTDTNTLYQYPYTISQIELSLGNNAKIIKNVY